MKNIRTVAEGDADWSFRRLAVVGSAMNDGPTSVDAVQSMWPDYMEGQAARPVRVILVDDDPHIRKVISNELMADRRIDLVAQASGLRQGQRLVSKHRFDVLLVDLNLGDGSGFDLIKEVKMLHPDAEAIVLSVMEDEDHAMLAFDLGATGYLVKNCWFGSFSQAVLQVVNGGASITPNLARRLLHRLRPSAAQTGLRPDVHLSQREQEVLRMVASGYTSAEIGVELKISMQTVNAHVKTIYRKLRVRSRAEASAFAAKRGLL
ncbi:MAG: two component transcriptional regulator, LuxR family [Ramlibacter sp.]|jgi:DNA-binding NarL/FixJ family response regulator|nr:two component transcriptional regulator, LuxR family [Ramlibacter sp.]